MQTRAEINKRSADAFTSIASSCRINVRRYQHLIQPIIEARDTDAFQTAIMNAFQAVSDAIGDNDFQHDRRTSLIAPIVKSGADHIANEMRGKNK